MGGFTSVCMCMLSVCACVCCVCVCDLCVCGGGWGVVGDVVALNLSRRPLITVYSYNVK